MQVFTKPEPVIISYPLRNLAPAEKILFFDIETTGLTPANAQVYLIGALFHTEELGWQLTQWFADSLSAEQDILRDFFSFAENFDVIVHYNGDGFDVPFLGKCAAQYHLRNPLPEMKSLDLYRIVRPYRTLFSTERLNQKTMELFLGLNRADQYTGAELISVYEAYTVTADSAQLELLLLHNEEDVTGLAALLSLVAYRDFFNGEFRNPIVVDSGKAIILDCESASFLPHPVRLSLQPLTVSAKDNVLEIAFSVYEGELRHFFPDYRDYYYLPLEDKAVHKSVGEFVDRSMRKKATAETACIRKEGIFLPVFGAVNRPVFQPEYKSLQRYVQKDDYDFTNQETLLYAACEALKYMKLRTS